MTHVPPSPALVRRAQLPPDVRVLRVRYRAWDGRVRLAYVALPRWYRRRRDPSLPLVISPHGRGVSAWTNLTRWGDLPARGPFALVSPGGEGRFLALYSWGDPGQVDDLARMPRILTGALPWLRLERRRIYAFGGSMGGQETLLLVARHPRLLAGAAAFDAPTDLALRYRDFARLRFGSFLRWAARREVGGAPWQDPRGYAERSPLDAAAALARSGVPLQLWWSTRDRVVADQARQSALLYRRLLALRPRAPVHAFVGTWAHTAEMRWDRRLPLALRLFGLLPAVAAPEPPVAAGLDVPGFTPLRRGPAGGTLLEGVYPDASAPQPLRPGYLYLPPGFSLARRYPVVYLLHGMPGGPEEYVGSLAIARLADRLIASGAVRPFLAVMPAAGPSARYNGEWAGPWEDYLVRGVVPWVDAHLPTLARASGRTIAGLSAGGYGAVDVALRSPALFGRVESWSGYFRPLRDGSLRGASAAELEAHDPTRLVASEAARLRRLGTRFELSTGPTHSHWFTNGATRAFAARLRALRLPVTLRVSASRRGEWRRQLEAGLRWAFASA
ncbi:MAG TPA: alpha/beta hydrolase-fold protein [Gaiellaceae bacterium]|nr:alpha/beta hydrolase-fold protein [Gaiellaceae bacterium]